MNNKTYSITNTPNKFKYRWKFLFGDLYPNLLKYIKMDKISLYSTTDYKTSEIITNIVKNLPNIKYNSKIVDGTACIGGNSISFAKYFNCVYSVEIDENRSQLLINNINVYNLNNHITVINNDITVIYKDINDVDVYFLDPPWGGINYNNQTNIELYLSNIHLAKFCQMLRNYTKYIVIKVPLNFNIHNFNYILNTDDIRIFNVIKLKKMIIVILST